MALILHLTDLHLGGRPGDQSLDDYKSDIVPYAERVTRQELLKSTLRNLGRHLHKQKKTLDAVVVSGDVTVAGDPTGFLALPGLLAELDEVLPAADHIIVVPGNHDVTWKTLPSSSERYKNFVDLVRNKGYVTPFLDGVDLPSAGVGADYPQHRVSLDAGQVEIIPLNSSNYCGTFEPLHYLSEAQWQSLTDALPTVDPSSVRKELERLRQQDVPRFSPQQFHAVSQMLEAIGAPVRGNNPMRIAVLHHQLLPVSTSEEFKPYEAIVNLGALLRFLEANSFNVVLHGHKHTASAYWCDLRATDEMGGRTQALVISGSTVGGHDSQRREVCRLISVQAKTTAAQVILIPVPGIEAGSSVGSLEERHFPLWDVARVCAKSVDSVKVVEAESFDSVYDRLLSYFADRSEHDTVSNMVCEVNNVGYPTRLPPNYPDILDRFNANKQAWLDDLVRWWQRPNTVLDDPFGFTHGERIYKYGGDHNQFADAITALAVKRSTSRAIVDLVDPPRDGWKFGRKAPSFCSFQFTITKRDKNLVLNCIAYFRKQEMRYWWPVNYAELALMQNDAVERLSSTYNGIQPGSIVTIAAIAYASQSVPKVAVPIVDRLLDEDPDILWQLAYALAWPSVPAVGDLKGKWDRLLTDLVPDVKPDPDGVPIAIHGLKDLIREIGRFKRFHTGENIENAEIVLSSLLQINVAYAKETSTEEPTAERHKKWREECARSIDQLRVVLNRCWARGQKES